MTSSLFLESVVSFYESFNKESVSSLNRIYSEQVYFKDPFNEFHGIKNLQTLYNHMFENLYKPRFKILEYVQEGDRVFLIWNFYFKIKNTEYKIHGSSYLKFNTQGLIIFHRDYWDVGEELLLKIPVINKLYKIIQNKLTIEVKQ